MKILILTEKQYDDILSALTAAAVRRYEQGYDLMGERYEDLEDELRKTYGEPIDEEDED